MSGYTDDGVRAKLASLSETQESVVGVAQWVMFHRRYADRTVNLWLARLHEVSTTKRLNLIYLANEVVQQSRARSRPEYLHAFEPIIAEASALAYRSADANVRGKLRRVVEVWRERKIFDPSIQTAIEARLTELDKGSGSVSKAGSNGAAKSKGGKLGGGLFSPAGGVPTELEDAAAMVSTLSEMQDGMTSKVAKANEEFAKMTDPSTPVPTAPVRAARLNALGKTIATAQGAVEASLKARRELLSQMAKMLENQRTQLESDEGTLADLKAKREGVEQKKNEVEDSIMRGLSAPSSPDIPTPTNSAFASRPNGNQDPDSGKELDRPEAEDFTPPPPDPEDLFPASGFEPQAQDDPAHNVPQAETSFTSTTAAESFHEPPPASALPVDPSNAAAAAEQFLSSLAGLSGSGLGGPGTGQVRQASMEIPNADPRLKRRKLSHRSPGEEESEAGIDAGVDEDGISALLR